MSENNHPDGCSACRRNLSGSSESHKTLTEIEDAIGSEFTTETALQLLNALEQVTAQTHSQIREAIKENAFAFLQFLTLDSE